MEPAIEKNILLMPYGRGMVLSIVIDTTDIDLSEYQVIRADIKELDSLVAPAIHSLTLTDGIAVTTATVGDVTTHTLVATISEARTTVMSRPTYYMDIKCRISTGSPAIRLASIKLIKDETITDI